MSEQSNPIDRHTFRAPAPPARAQATVANGYMTVIIALHCGCKGPPRCTMRGLTPAGPVSRDAQVPDVCEPRHTAAVMDTARDSAPTAVLAMGCVAWDYDLLCSPHQLAIAPAPERERQQRCLYELQRGPLPTGSPPTDYLTCAVDLARARELGVLLFCPCRKFARTASVLLFGRGACYACSACSAPLTLGPADLTRGAAAADCALPHAIRAKAANNGI